MRKVRVIRHEASDRNYFTRHCSAEASVNQTTPPQKKKEREKKIKKKKKTPGREKETGNKNTKMQLPAEPVPHSIFKMEHVLKIPKLPKKIKPNEFSVPNVTVVLVVTRPQRDPGISRDPGIGLKSRSRDFRQLNPVPKIPGLKFLRTLGPGCDTLMKN